MSGVSSTSCHSSILVLGNMKARNDFFRLSILERHLLQKFLDQNRPKIEWNNCLARENPEGGWSFWCGQSWCPPVVVFGMSLTTSSDMTPGGCNITSDDIGYRTLGTERNDGTSGRKQSPPDADWFEPNRFESPWIAIIRFEITWIAINHF